VDCYYLVPLGDVVFFMETKLYDFFLRKFNLKLVWSMLYDQS